VEQAVAPSPVGRPMSWEQFLALPDEARAEYSDGKAYVPPPPTFAHQEVCQRLRDVIKTQLGPSVVVAVGVAWQLPGDRQRLRVPDLMVLADVPPGDVVTTAPLVVVEVLSSNRSDDLVRKSTEYLAAGVGQYWIVDHRDRVIDVFQHAASGWDLVARLSDDVPTAAVMVPSYGDVQLSLHEVLT
jgi:Uma2 family endonuclease